MEENRLNGYTIPLSNFQKIRKNKIDIYFGLSNINSDTFEKNIISSKEVNDKAMFEIGKIIKRLTQIQKKYGGK